MTAIEKMEHYLMTVDRNIVSFGDILDKVKELAKEEQKPKQMVGMLEVIDIKSSDCTTPKIQDYKGLVEELERELSMAVYFPATKHRFVREDEIREILAKFKVAK